MKVFAGVLACVAAAVSVFAFVRSQGTSFRLVAPILLLTFALLDGLDLTVPFVIPLIAIVQQLLLPPRPGTASTRRCPTSTSSPRTPTRS